MQLLSFLISEEGSRSNDQRRWLDGTIVKYRAKENNDVDGSNLRYRQIRLQRSILQNKFLNDGCEIE